MNKLSTFLTSAFCAAGLSACTSAPEEPALKAGELESVSMNYPPIIYKKLGLLDKDAVCVDVSALITSPIRRKTYECFSNKKQNWETSHIYNTEEADFARELYPEINQKFPNSTKKHEPQLSSDQRVTSTKIDAEISTTGNCSSLTASFEIAHNGQPTMTLTASEGCNVTITAPTPSP